MTKENDLKITNEQVIAYFDAFISMRKKELFFRDSAVLIISKDKNQEVFFLGNWKWQSKKMEKLKFAAEKLQRIMTNNLMNSFEMSDEKLHQYGGAIKINDNFHISCSGFPPHMDQEFSLFIADMMRVFVSNSIIENTKKDYKYWEDYYKGTVG